MELLLVSVAIIAGLIIPILFWEFLCFITRVTKAKKEKTMSMDKSKTSQYSVDVFCFNCGVENMLVIDKGTDVDETECPRCGSYALMNARLKERIVVDLGDRLA